MLLQELITCVIQRDMFRCNTVMGQTYQVFSVIGDIWIEFWCLEKVIIDEKQTIFHDV